MPVVAATRACPSPPKGTSVVVLVLAERAGRWPRRWARIRLEEPRGLRSPQNVAAPVVRRTRHGCPRCPLARSRVKLREGAREIPAERQMS
jgi:hypothetical protein